MKRYFIKKSEKLSKRCLTSLIREMQNRNEIPFQHPIGRQKLNFLMLSNVGKYVEQQEL